MASTDKNNTTEPGIAVPDFAAAHPAWLRLEARCCGMTTRVGTVNAGTNG